MTKWQVDNYLGATGIIFKSLSFLPFLSFTNPKPFLPNGATNNHRSLVTITSRTERLTRSNGSVVRVREFTENFWQIWRDKTKQNRSQLKQNTRHVNRHFVLVFFIFFRRQLLYFEMGWMCSFGWVSRCVFGFLMADKSKYKFQL